MVEIRPERPDDEAAIGTVTAAAFQGVPGSDQTEPDIVEALREDGALSVSLVAEAAGLIIGHVAFSRVEIAVSEGDWYGLGPVSVDPVQQGRGIGQALIRAGLDQLRAIDAAGCVLLGDPAYYGRFGFEADPALRYKGEASPYIQRLVLKGAPPAGEILYHPSFGAA